MSLGLWGVGLWGPGFLARMVVREFQEVGSPSVSSELLFNFSGSRFPVNLGYTRQSFCFPPMLRMTRAQTPAEHCKNIRVQGLGFWRSRSNAGSLQSKHPTPQPSIFSKFEENFCICLGLLSFLVVWDSLYLCKKDPFFLPRVVWAWFSVILRFFCIIVKPEARM